MHNIQGSIRFRFVILRGNILNMNLSNINSRLQMMISATKKRKKKKTPNEYVRLWVRFEQHRAMCPTVYMYMQKTCNGNETKAFSGMSRTIIDKKMKIDLNYSDFRSKFHRKR